MKRKRPVSKKKQLALASHERFMRGMGIDTTKKPLLRGAVVNPLHAESGARDEPRVSTSDKVPGNGSARRANPVLALPVAQVYHKGPIMVVTDPSTLDGSKRRS